MAQSCDRIVHALRSAGVKIDLAHLSRRATDWRMDTKQNGRDIICPVANDEADTLNRLWNLLARDRTRYSHVVAFGGLLPLTAAPIFAAWLGVPLVTLLRGNDFDVAIFTPRRADILREALRQSARVCVVSRDKEGKIKALLPDVPITWIPNGINLSDWQILPSHQKKARNWHQEQVSEHRRVLGMFGHIKQKKGGVFFLETLLSSELAERFHLLFVGEFDEAVTDFLHTHESEIAYSIFPFTDRYDLLRHYAACDFVVIASFYDGMPNVMLEASALGIPLLASQTGGMADVLRNGEHGFLFYPGDAHECREALERSAAIRPDELQRLSDNCRLLVRESLTQEREAAAYLDVFLETRRENSENAPSGNPASLSGE
jgi:glycosyltransferase involved in cell wall biosynthesis